jgi:hypothetical protein
MCSRYISERAIISCMARELRDLHSLTRPLASLQLIIAGFGRRDVATYLDRAIESERARRLAMCRPLVNERIAS